MNVHLILLRLKYFYQKKGDIIYIELGVMKVPYCPECGEEVSYKMKFCPKCGVSLVTVQPKAPRIEEKKCKRVDILGAISAGIILIIFVVTYIKYPINPSIIIEYFESMTEQRAFIKPPSTFFDPAIFFLYAAGVWGIVLSGLRILFQRSARKALGDLIGGFFSFFLAYLLTNYAADVYSGRTTLAYFVMSIGLLIGANSIVLFALTKK